MIEKNEIAKRDMIIAITDTTGNMRRLGSFLRIEGYEHGYCGCHSHTFHRNAILAFDDDNLPGVLKRAQALVEFFNSSTQATDKLLNFQCSSGIEQYAGQIPKRFFRMLSP
ncbi:hypothetical protein ACHAXR_000041, partial [Thalassiosira sp. AJA248-18]